MGVKATDFGSILIEQRVGFKGDLKFQENFIPTKLVGEGVFGRNEDDNFGYSVSIDGSLAVVGVPYQDYDETGAATEADAGAVFVYRRNRDSWEFAYKITASDRDAGDNFGYSVSLKGNTLAVGSPKHALNAAQTNPVVGAGAVYTYSITDTEATFEAKLLPENRDANDNFGYSVTVFANMVYVGSYKHARNEREQIDAPEAGAVWAFTRNSSGTWTRTKKIVAGGNDRNPYDNFGSAISAHKNTLVVGVPNFDYINKGTDLKNNAGAAYVFEWKTDHWEFKTLIIAPDREEGDEFGSAVAVYDKRIAISSPGKNSNRGKVYLYALNDIGTYALTDETYPTMLELPVEYTQPEGSKFIDNARYGFSLSMNSETLAVGAPGQMGLNMTSVDKGVNPYTWTASELYWVGFGYVYSLDETNTATLTNKFEGADRFNDVEATREQGQFGYSVSIGTNILVFGQPRANRSVADTNALGDAGLAHIYVKGDNGYEFSKSVEGFHVERNANDNFGSDFESNDRFMVFSAPNQDYDANHENFMSNTGAVYVWENVGGSWTFRQKITASDRTANDNFGTKLTLLGDRIFIQSLGTDNIGSVYVFRFENGKFVEKQKITHTDMASNNRFGSVMLARDNRLFLSSTNVVIPLTDATTRAHGAVYSYILNGASDQYEFDAKIVPTTATNVNSLFGGSLALIDNVLIVGAQGQQTDVSDLLPLTSSGAVFVFARVDNAWTQINKLTGPGSDRSSGDYMGYAVSGFGNTLAVGVPGSDYDATLLTFRNDAGKVYIYTRVGNSWNLSSTLTSPNRQEGGRFGASLSMGDNRILVGAPGETAGTQVSGWGEGRAYVFERVYGEWVVTGTLSNDETILAGNARRFGWAVSLDGNRAIIGEPLNTTDVAAANPLSGAGAAWVFEKVGDTWVKRAKLTQQALSSRAAGNNFGFSVDIKGAVAIVGAPYDQTNDAGGATLDRAGSASVFRRNETSEGVVSWVAEKKFAGWAQDRNASDLFGTAIAAYGNTVIVSATGHDYDSNRENFVDNAGAVYVYEWVDNALVYKQKLVAHDQADRISNVGFGNAVAVNATHIVVGANLFPKNGSGTVTARQIGKVWSFKNENGLWIKERTFVPSVTDELNSANVSINPNFGKSLALSHLVLAIGAPGAYYGNNEAAITGAGAVEVYRYNVDHWDFERVLTPSTRGTNDAFGTTIALRDNLAIIGGPAPATSTTSMNADGIGYTGGAAWVFQYDIPNWNYTSKIARGQVERVSGDNFGNSVAISGNTMVLGAVAQGWDDTGKLFYANAGAAYVFKQINGSWNFEKKIFSPTRQAQERFGHDVAIKDDLIWVGAPGTLINSVAVGSAYAFRRNTLNSSTRYNRQTASFIGTGASQTFTVPTGVTEVTAFMWGAAGGASSTQTNGGNGGFVRVKIPVVEGEVLTLNVGRKPALGAGGGRSEIIRDGSTLAVAGGGGGATNVAGGGYYAGTAGNAGGLRGEDAYVGNELTLPGLGGSQTAGGAARSGATYTSGTAGAFKQGGSGPVDGTATTIAGGWPNGGSATVKSNAYAIAGGGDGWYGGSAGAILTAQIAGNYSTAGGAGSSYIAPGLEGYTQSVKEFDDALTLFPATTYRPAFNNDGMIALEWFIDYTVDDWSYDGRVVPTGVPTNATFRFGEALDFDGATLVVGAPGNTFNEDTTVRGSGFGATFAYEFNGFEWEQSGALYPFGLNTTLNSEFGSYVSVFEDYIAVGSYNQQFDEAGEDGLSGAGLVFVYRKENGLWTKVQRVGPPGNVRNAGDLIGSQVAYSNDWIAVGAPQHDFDTNVSNKVANSGAVFMWKWDAGVLTNKQKIIAPTENRLSNAFFGSAIHFENGELLIAAPGQTTGGSDALYRGIVYVYELIGDTWEVKQEIVPPTGVNQTLVFGAAVDRHGDTLAIGSTAPDASAIRINTNSIISYRPAPFSTIVDPTKDWSIEVGFYKADNANTFDIVSSLNYFTAGTNGGFSIYLSAGGMFADFTNSTTVITRLTTPVGIGWHILGVRRTGNTYQLYVDGVLSGSAAVTSSNVPLDLRNGLTFGRSVHNINKIVDFIRINNESIDLTLNQGEEIGARPSSVFFVNYSEFVNNGYDDLTGNYTGLASNSSDLTFVPGKANTTNLGGVVHMFNRNGETWEYDSTVSPTGTNAYAAGDNFGSSLTLVDDFLIVGSPAHRYDQDGNLAKTGAGASFFFQNIEGTWTQQQKVVAWGHDTNASDWTGYEIAAADTIVAVGSPYHAYDANGNNYVVGAGAVYVWRWDSAGSRWILEQKVVAPNRVANALFGRAIALTESRMVVGAPSYDDNTKPGKAFVFEKTPGDTAINCWNAGTELTPVGTNAYNNGDRYGLAVAINSDNEVIVTSLNGYDVNGANNVIEAGSAYVFKKSAIWSMAQKLVLGTNHLGTPTVPARGVSDWFGLTVSTSGNDLIVGTPYRDSDGRGVVVGNAGAAIAFSRADDTENWAQVQVITAKSNTVVAGDRLGTAVSGDGDYFVVGAIGNSYDANEDYYVAASGSAYVWFNDGVNWTYHQKLSGSIRNASGLYGASAKMYGDLLFIGAPGTTFGGNLNQGVVFVYELVDGFFEEIQVLSIDNSALPYKNSQFGSSIDYDGETLAIGSRNSVLPASSFGVGKVNFFERDSGTGQFNFVQSIYDPTAPNNANGGSVGASISIVGDLCVAGAPYESIYVSNGGAAAIFRRVDGVWTFEDKVYPQRPVAESGMAFGSTWAADGNYLAIGAPAHDYNRLNRTVTDGGAVFVFELVGGNWTYKQKVTPIGTNQHNSGDRFGTSIGLQNGLLVVGAPNHMYDVAGAAIAVNYGAVFAFELDVDGYFKNQTKISPQGYGSNESNLFGTSLILNDNVLVVGAPGSVYGVSAADNGGGYLNVGSAMVYKRIDNVWHFVQKLAPTPLSARESSLEFGRYMSFNDGYLAIGTPAASKNEFDEDAISNAGSVWTYKVESLDGLNVNLIGGKPAQPATTQIVFDSEDGTFESVAVPFAGISYKGHPEAVYSIDAFKGHAMMNPVGVANPKLLSAPATAVDPTITVVRDQYDTTGTGASVVLTRSGATLLNVTLTDGGEGYTNIPTVTANSGVGVVLQAVLEPTEVATLSLTNSGSGFTAFPTILIDSPDSGGTTAQAHVVMETDGVLMQASTKSYVGESFTVSLDTANLRVKTLTVDANYNSTSIAIDVAGQFSALPNFANRPAVRVIETQTFGAVIDPIAGGDTSEDYGLVTEGVTGSEDYGLVTEGITSSEDYQVSNNAVSYGSVDDTVLETISYGPITASTMTLSLTAKISDFILDNPGSGYRRVPAVSFGGSFATAATATATIAPTSVEAVNILSAGNNLSQSTQIIFTGTNTRPATATAEVSEGIISGIQLVSAGSGYTRTPKLVFSESGFSASIELAPTTVNSVVTTATDPTLTIQGRVNMLRRLAEPTNMRREAQNFGVAIAGHENILAVGAPTDALTSATSTVRSSSGSVIVYEVSAKEDRLNKVLVDGWLDASTVINNIGNTFSFSVWIRSNQRHQNLSGGTIFAITNGTDRPGYSAVEDGSPLDLGVANPHMLVLDNAGQIRVTAESEVIGFNTSNFVIHEWNNVVYTCNAGVISVYVNGVLAGTKQTDATITANSLFSIGAAFDNHNLDDATENGFIGYMSDITIWNAALDQTDVDALQTDSSTSVKASNVRANWIPN